MSITPVLVMDATHLNINVIPVGTLAALYTTGSPDIKATAADFNKHPNAIHICQDHGSDETADILDSETGAATIQDCINWLPRARAAFNNKTRPGQRWPGLYMSLSTLTEHANALASAHLTNVPLWIAEWGLDQASAIHNIIAENGPFPTVAFQIKNEGPDDISFFSDEWLNRRSAMGTPTPPQHKAAIPPGQWNDAHSWEWAQAAMVGIGKDGQMHAFMYDVTHDRWTKVV